MPCSDHRMLYIQNWIPVYSGRKVEFSTSMTYHQLKIALMWMYAMMMRCQDL